MPILKSSKKAVRQNKKNKIRNDRRRRQLHDVLKDFYNLVKAGELKKAGEMLTDVYKTIDMSAKNNIIPKKRAGRMKSKAQKSINVEAK
jgi:ribosomal protein S20